MEIFRELCIQVEADRMAAIADQIGRDAPGGWQRDRATEEKARSAALLKSGATYCFRCSAEGCRPPAILILTQKEAGTFFVSNIIPLSKHQLGHGEYNAVLEDFYARVIQTYTGSAGMAASLSGGRVDLEHWMSHNTAELLRRFSACANRGTGAAHPLDRDRWNSFVVASHRDGNKISAEELRRWLIEVDEWAPEVADQLAVEYGYGRELLAHAEGRRGA